MVGLLSSYSKRQRCCWASRKTSAGSISFPVKTPKTLIEKYNAQLAKLDTSKGVLFLVDTWGGSPFNAASRIVVDKEHYEVVAGVNIPMLVETLHGSRPTIRRSMSWWRWPLKPVAKGKSPEGAAS
ncbi:PTS mannose transporter subunit IIAB [Enterobacter asburiae]|uniref:PTS mannose transporter subunit IIAB n=1 Tax=Enterobacter asburiae TaxID=61645 RepID=A0A376F9X5_ENTAS|nr:PTS mannose transporter subunit IIAB [Enterobacter asburiae]